MILILHNIRSAHNVGSILRSADGAGGEKVYLCGYTPAPLDRFGRTQGEIQKVALGAEESVAWEQRESTEEVISELKEQGVQILALEQHPDSTSLFEVRPKGTFALVVGNETEGIPEGILKQVDQIIEIPMYGEKESLNVAVATGIALYQLRPHN